MNENLLRAILILLRKEKQNLKENFDIVREELTRKEVEDLREFLELEQKLINDKIYLLMQELNQ